MSFQLWRYYQNTRIFIIYQVIKRGEGGGGGRGEGGRGGLGYVYSYMPHIIHTRISQRTIRKEHEPNCKDRTLK